MTAGQTIDRRQAVAGLGAAGLLGGGPRAWAQAKPGTPVGIANTLGLLTQTMTALMRQQRFLEELGLAPSIVGVADGTRIMSALLGGDIDLANLTGFNQVFPAIEKGGKLKVIGGGGTVSAGLAMYTGKPAIQSLKDLEGKIVGSGSPGALVHQMTVALLKKKGVDYRKVQFVNIGSSVDVFRAVSVGTVDAGLGDGTYMADQERYKVRALPGGHLATDLPEYTNQGAFTTDRVIETKRDVLVRTMAAYGKLFRLVHSPEGKEPFLKAREEAAKAGSRGEGELLWSYVQKYKPFAVNLVFSEERIDYLQGLNVELGVQRKVLPFAQVADMSIARDAVKLLGGDV